jgi:amidohydrolase
MSAKLLSEIQAGKSFLVEQRRFFHQHPEPSLEEFGTAERIERELASAGIPNRRVGKTGVLGTIRGERAGSGAKLGKIVLRADIDALRIQDAKTCAYASRTAGIAHVCGHDAHIAALVGAARVLQANRGLFVGEVALVFQPAEEIGEGAKEFIADGVLEGAGRVFGVHLASDIPAGKIALRTGPNNASVDYFCATIHGKSAHVSTPQRGVDALYAASQLVIALQAIVTRQTSPVEPLLIGVGTFSSGTSYNIVAEKAVLEGTLRSFSPQLREETKRKIAATGELAAAASNASFDIAWKDFTPPLINDETARQEALRVAAGIVGPENVVQDRTLSLAGDNFAEFLQQVPGVYAYIGSGNPFLPATVLPHHNSGFDIDEDALVPAAAMYAEYALWFLENFDKEESNGR